MGKASNLKVDDETIHPNEKSENLAYLHTSRCPPRSSLRFPRKIYCNPCTCLASLTFVSSPLLLLRLRLLLLLLLHLLRPLLLLLLLLLFLPPRRYHLLLRLLHGRVLHRPVRIPTHHLRLMSRNECRRFFPSSHHRHQQDRPWSRWRYPTYTRDGRKIKQKNYYPEISNVKIKLFGEYDDES